MLCASLLTLPEIGAGLRERSTPLFAAFSGTAVVVLVGIATRLLDFRGFM